MDTSSASTPKLFFDDAGHVMTEVERALLESARRGEQSRMSRDELDATLTIALGKLDEAEADVVLAQRASSREREQRRLVEDEIARLTRQLADAAVVRPMARDRWPTVAARRAVERVAELSLRYLPSDLAAELIRLFGAHRGAPLKSIQVIEQHQAAVELIRRAAVAERR